MSEIEITQEDRLTYIAIFSLSADVMAGTYDRTTAMKAIARHRQAARERALDEAAEVAFKYPFTDHEHSNPAVCWNAAQEIASQIRKLKEG